MKKENITYIAILVLWVALLMYSVILIINEDDTTGYRNMPETIRVSKENSEVEIEVPETLEKELIDEFGEPIEITASQLLEFSRLEENEEARAGIPYKQDYNNKLLSVSGRVTNIDYKDVYLDCKAEGLNFVVVCKVKEFDKYSLNEEISILGIAKYFENRVEITEI